MVFARSARVREQFDWPLFLAVVCIAIIGVVNLYSATSPYIDDPRRSGEHPVQVVARLVP